MQELLINHPRLIVHRRTGEEGPRHDPYHFEELSVTTPSGKTIIRSGIGVKLTHNGQEVHAPFNIGSWEKREAWLLSEGFTNLAGISQKAIARITRRLKSRCHKCGGRNFHEAKGYPGEYFTVCDSCGHINGSQFFESEIM